jgi:hypothetical protein
MLRDLFARVLWTLRWWLGPKGRSGRQLGIPLGAVWTASGHFVAAQRRAGFKELS